MKQLTRIRLINWHLFENAAITCQGTTYFIGINGAGKSTILDAVQFALVGGQRDVKFNQAAMAGSRRTLTSYVRGELGTEGRRFLRGDATGVVALEFRNPDGSHFAHGAVIDAYEDGRSPDITYFIVNNAALNDEWFFRTPPLSAPVEGTNGSSLGNGAGTQAGQLFDSRAFRRHMEHFALPPGGRAQIFSRLEDYRFHLLNRLGQLKETFPAKIVKGLAFSPLTNIRDFVHNYLLDENLVDVKTLQDQLETMRHFENLAADIRQRIAALDRIEELDQERQANRRRRITNGTIRRRAQADSHLAQLKRFRQELDEKQVALSRAELQRDELAERRKLTEQALLDARVALKTDTTAARQKALRQRIADLETQRRDLRQRQATLTETLIHELEDARQLRGFLLEDGQPVSESLDTFIALASQIGHQQSADADSLLEAIRELQADLDALGHRYAGQAALLDEQGRGLREEGEQLQREIAQLRTGDRDASYEAEAPQAARLRRLLRAELDLGPDEVIFLCTALNVPDESWQDAVEGVLGRARFNLLVPPEYYDAAMRLYRKRRHQDNLYGVGLPDTERIMQHAHPASSLPTGGGLRGGSLVAEVQTDHPAARAFVDLLLGGYVKCDRLEDLREHRTAVTRECFVRRNYTTSHLNPRHYRRWFIGERAIPRQIEAREERLEAIREELIALSVRSDSLRQRLALTQAKVRLYIELERDLPGLTDIPALVTELDALRDELAALDTQSVEALRAEVERHQASVYALQAEAGQLERHIGGLGARIEVLSDETIPSLEREADQVLQDAHQFLAHEDVEDMLDEVSKEYERRRQRQPLETVLTNATRYEGDYQTAENRSRDRLREAKQTYSLTYQFGTDNDEDAARYLRERDRYVKSELPQYEARIAEQRALAEQELVENFIHRLREQIEDARQQLGYLNTTLAQLRFGGERFEFIARPEPSLRQVYDMIMDSHTILGDSLFESDFRQRHQQGWDLLFELLTAGPDDDLMPELRKLQDYRNYLQYDIRIHYPNGDRALLSQINAKKSGGETTTPFYVAMAASFAQAYRLNQPRPSDTIRLALFDEAFGKMDTARTASALHFMVESKLQVLLATPPDKAGGLLPHVDCVRTVVRKNNHAFVIEIDKTEVMQELEGAEYSRSVPHG
jgi:uncharacterized protein YPO0396